MAFTKNLLAQIPDHRGVQQLLDRVPPASARTHAESVCSTMRDAIGKPPASRAGSMSARINPSAAAMGPGGNAKLSAASTSTSKAGALQAPADNFTRSLATPFPNSHAFPCALFFFSKYAKDIYGAAADKPNAYRIQTHTHTHTHTH